VGIQQIIASVGVWAESAVLSMGRSISFFGEFILTLLGGSGQKNRYFLSNFINQIYLAGIRAIPIVMVTNFVVGVVLSYQGIIQLAKFSAESSILTVVSFSVFREAGALMSAIIIAGRSGSAFAAEMGVMNLNEELQALRIMGVKSMSFLILPRVLALLIFMPILTLIANFMGLLGGAVICWVELDMGLYYFFYQVHDITTPFFSLIIGLISCFMGLNVKKTPESLGVNTTRAVVLSIFWVIVFNSLFSVIVSALKLG